MLLFQKWPLLLQKPLSFLSDSEYSEVAKKSYHNSTDNFMIYMMALRSLL